MTASEKPSKLTGVFGLLLETFRLYVGNFHLYFGYAAWLLVPLVISVLAFVSTTAETFELIDFASTIVHALLLIWASIVIIQITERLHTKKSIPRRKLGETAWTLWTSFMLTYLLVVVVELTGAILLIIPGIIFFVWFEFAPQIVTLERTPILASLSTSRELSRGRFWAVLWRLAGGLTALLAVYMVLFGVVLFAGYSGTDLAIYDYVLAEPTLAQEVMYRLIDIVIFPLVLIFQTRLYLELKATQ